ncbi:hypothetical protein SADUNF_Sadunf01G0151300 [Salix dunnii]|uniref:Sulfite exporter TauE/SafE family protein n=1 Tax=Salix dunnii TaxID=1413687 RepID=A0A835NBT7_9ROSI|nr:hypothetical protein SADUNF_Sadunf01G0151300 [Salix dunnii]
MRNLMARIQPKHWVSKLLGAILSGSLVAALILVFGEPSLTQEGSRTGEAESHRAMRILSLVREKGRVGYTHVWPINSQSTGTEEEMRFGWKIVLSSVIGFFGAACGSVGGVGGGGIFVPMLTLIIGFDTKSATAMSKCMITGGAAATVYYNLKLRHPTLELPIIDYDLALLFQPMLVLGISIGVALNVIFANWMITILLIVLFIVTSTKAFFKGVETWKKETKTKKEATRSLESNDDRNEVVGAPPPCGPTDGAQTETKEYKKEEVSIIENVYWRELALLVAVWVIILALQIGKIPVAFGVSSYEAFNLYKGRRKIASKGDAVTIWKVRQLVLYCIIGLLAGIVGGMLGLGGGFILGPLFLEMGIPPQVSSATATFAMMFSASMSVVEYYLLKRFPVPYALYFFAVATVAALVGQHVVRKLISILGRASLIIFTLAFTIFVSALLLGGVGIARMVKRIERKEYMGFENICS